MVEGIEGGYGGLNYGFNSVEETINNLFTLMERALEAQHEITQSIFKAFEKADKELAAFTKQLEKSRRPNKEMKISQLKAKADKLMNALKMVDPADNQGIQTKLAMIMGRLDEMKRQAAAQAAPSSQPARQDPNIF
ncbi:MAG: hypothetical protein JW873_01300 [Candidatus Saganbacteria bacterium]|nr:hypothetical protein [Candidatus Saganbacteria bacterium]